MIHKRSGYRIIKIHAERQSKQRKLLKYLAVLVAHMSQLFGVFARHSPESCPLNNAHSKEIVNQIDSKMNESMPKTGVKKIVGFYFSVLEHEWTIIVEAEDAHGIEKFCIGAGISAFNTIKIVPLTDFGAAMKKILGNK